MRQVHADSFTSLSLESLRGDDFKTSRASSEELAIFLKTASQCF